MRLATLSRSKLFSSDEQSTQHVASCQSSKQTHPLHQSNLTGDNSVQALLGDIQNVQTTLCWWFPLHHQCKVNCRRLVKHEPEEIWKETTTVSSGYHPCS